MEKTIYDLDLHEAINIQVFISKGEGTYINYSVMRVPGGWLYRTALNGHPLINFVPFDSEYSMNYDENGRELGKREK